MLRAILPLLPVLALAAGCVESEPPTIKAIDRDGDGFAEGADDCDDGNPNVHIEAPEVCDGVDNNCDGFTDDADPTLDVANATPFFADTDRDGHGDPNAEVLACAAPSGHVDEAYADDCDDTDDSVSPEASEICDDVDKARPSA